MSRSGNVTPKAGKANNSLQVPSPDNRASFSSKRGSESISTSRFSISVSSKRGSASVSLLPGSLLDKVLGIASQEGVLTEKEYKEFVEQGSRASNSILEKVLEAVSKELTVEEYNEYLDAQVDDQKVETRVRKQTELLKTLLESGDPAGKRGSISSRASSRWGTGLGDDDDQPAPTPTATTPTNAMMAPVDVIAICATPTATTMTTTTTSSLEESNVRFADASSEKKADVHISLSPNATLHVRSSSAWAAKFKAAKVLASAGSSTSSASSDVSSDTSSPRSPLVPSPTGSGS